MKHIIFISLFLCVSIFSQTQPGWNALDTTVIPIHTCSYFKIEFWFLGNIELK